MSSIPDAAIQHLPSTGPLQASVILLHGYAASAVGQLVDGEVFVNASIEVVMPDAPSHGARQDGRLEQIAALPDEQRLLAIYDIARQWAQELPSVAVQCRQRGARCVGVAGISMGGFAALAALAQPCPFDAVAAVLAAPTLLDSSTVTAGRPPLLLGLAGRDDAVAPDSGRRFAREYGAELHEYPQSEHFMRADDWVDLWGKTGGFLRRHLVGD